MIEKASCDLYNELKELGFSSFSVGIGENSTLIINLHKKSNLLKRLHKTTYKDFPVRVVFVDPVKT